MESCSTFENIISPHNVFKGKHALVGDYLRASYFNTNIVLSNLGFNVTIVPTIEEIVDKISKGEKYDIIFTNNIYNLGTGKDLLDKLKNITNFNIPIVIHTISDNIDNYFIKQGFNGYLQKPIKQEETLTLLKKILGD